METINIGLIGTGFMGKGHAMAYQMVPKIFSPAPAFPNLVVVGDVTEDLARKGARDFGAEGWVVGWEQVVDDERVDLVDITTPNNLHKEIALASAKAGKHIYCEKPLALTGKDAKEMYEAAARAGVITMVGFNFIKNPVALLAKEMIEAGELGEIYHFRGSFHQDVLADPNAPFSWRFDRLIAGSGALADLGSHVIEFARFLVGDFERVCGLAKTFIEERPLAAGVSGYRSKATSEGSTRTVENEDSIHFLIEFKGGATGTIEASRIATGRKVFMAYEVNGSKGSLHFVHERMNELNVYLSTDPTGRQGFKTILAGPEHPYYESFWPVAGIGLGYEDMKIIEVYELLDALANNEPAYPDFKEGWKVCQVIDAVLLSVEEGRWVSVEEI
ncbi:MAG: Gfo/Idh/MocA family oxidoreductase [Chloroflexi bacterium]|nr:Gfo/Idh/MocA family oxidoreductase [Chloroflexota bacterium]